MAEVLMKHARMPRKAKRVDAGIVLTKAPELDETGKPKLPERTRSSGIGKRPLATLPDAERAEIARTVLERYIHGEQVSSIAGDYQTSDVTIYALLLREHEGAWADIQKARALARLERETKNLEVAGDPLSLARARELVRAAQWELERLLNRLYGQKQEMTVTVNTDLGDRLRRARERVIDATIAPQQAIPDLSAASSTD